VLENSSAGRADVCAVDSPLHDSALVIKPILVEEPNTLSQALRKRSTHLSLVLISAAALTGVAGCGNLEKDGANSRDVYANMEACKADWGTPGDCEEIEPGRSATGSRSFYGPRYYSRSGASGYTSTPRPGSRSSGSVSSSPSRGGFGASSARHSGSSSHSSGG
jgi:hypothetical protein